MPLPDLAPLLFPVTGPGARVPAQARMTRFPAPTGLYQGVDLRPLLGRITCPTLIVAGELDFICGPAQAQPIASSIPGSQLVMLPGCSHIPIIEAPEQYRQAVAGFLSR